MNRPSAGNRRSRGGLLLTLWLIVLLEVVLPIPGVLTVTAVWVLAARPPWFADLVRELYS